MKTFKRILILLTVLALALSTVPAAFATPSAANVSVAPGNTVTVSFTFRNLTDIGGYLEFSNPGMFSRIEVIGDTMSGEYNADNGWFGFVSTEPVSTFTLTVKLTASNRATPGETCRITCNYEISDNNQLPANPVYTSESLNVNVVTPTVVPPVNVDYTELLRQIGIAEGLVATDYTSATWAPLTTALDAARAATESEIQAEVDAAAEDLESAIAALVPMDLAALRDAIAQVRDLAEDEDVADLWLQMHDLLVQANDAMVSGDQALVDSLTQQILALLPELIEAMEEQVRTETIIERVEVEVYPEGEFCNIPLHQVWPILFWISLALNAGLIVLVVVIVSKKKKKETDNTPLVDYDIGDDA